MNSQLLTVQTLANDVQVLILCLSYSITAVRCIAAKKLINTKVKKNANLAFYKVSFGGQNMQNHTKPFCVPERMVCVYNAWNI